MARRSKGSSASSSFRFNVGTRVICRTGRDEWSAGVIVALKYRESDWPAGRTVPYQVQLDNGGLIFVPMDNDELCRKLVPPWWASVFEKSASLHAEHNPSAEHIVQEGAGKDVNQQDHEGRTALMEAVAKRWLKGISQLIEMNADVNVAANDKTRAIHIAAKGNPSSIDSIKLLINANADLNIQDHDPDYDPDFTSNTFGDRIVHRTALHYVCMEGDAAAAKLLLEAKADPDIGDAQYKTPLHLAMEADEMQIIDVLLSCGADMNAGNQSSGMDNSALMDAAAAGKLELVEKLIAAKADINKQGKQQMSALHLAARSRRAEVCKLLLAAQADMNQESKLGTALQLACKNGGKQLFEVFDLAFDTLIVDSISSLDAAQRAALFMD
eukprot:TRINITY_DN9925_c0_g1_i1.p1 TRINITY_DN9925_c0_g1~~TRINITY_DN9925_c0_g1_i1.p1  ORF type:complete len:384 (+),score=104.14 TRINITY_DN9925_c0_g1_i1:113-1264(+)